MKKINSFNELKDYRHEISRKRDGIVKIELARKDKSKASEST